MKLPALPAGTSLRARRSGHSGVELALGIGVPPPPPGPPGPPGLGSLLRGWLRGGPDRDRERPGLPPHILIATASLNILAALLLGFLAQVTVMGTLRHNRDQQVAYDDLRLALAEGTAPTGPLVDGEPLRPGEPVARLEVPAIGLKEIVLEGTTAGILRSGPGHRRDTVMPGQTGTSVVMGRRMAYGGPFSQLAGLVKDDTVKIVTGQGETEFKVLGVFRAGDPLVPTSAGSARLTLMTTTGSRFAPNGVVRVVAQATTPQPAAAPRFTAATLPKNETALKGEPGALGAVTRWGFLLVCAAVTSVVVRIRWGRWQAWTLSIPVLGYLGVTTADHVVRLLPNLL